MRVFLKLNEENSEASKMCTAGVLKDSITQGEACRDKLNRCRSRGVGRGGETAQLVKCLPRKHGMVT